MQVVAITTATTICIAGIYLAWFGRGAGATVYLYSAPHRLLLHPMLMCAFVPATSYLLIAHR